MLQAAAKEPKARGVDLSPALAVAPAEKRASKAHEVKEKAPGGGQFQTIVDSLATATGSDPSEFTDDTLVADIGVDSIMAIEVVAAVKELGVELPAAFVFDFPTIGDLRREFGGQDVASPERETGEGPSSEDEDENAVSPTPDADEDLSPIISVPESVTSSASSVVHVEKETATPAPEAVGDDEKDENDTSPPPSVRITLLQGRPNTAKTPLYMMADGTGTVASFIHLRPFKSKQAVYGVDSPFFRCPSRMTSKVGIEGVARLVVDALIKAHPTGPFLIGGYSAGCLVAFEVSRQLAAASRTVDGLLLVDMCCPRTRRADQPTLLEEDEFSYAVVEAAVARDGLWGSIGSQRDHFRAFFVAMNEYTPAPMTPSERPARTAVIWAERGLVNRVSDDPALMQRLAGQGVPTEPYAGFMEDPCLVPDKGENLGPNGWDRYTAGDVMALSVAGDHFELPMPGHVHLLQAQMEKAFAYFASN
ncbi:hypothetical protein SLS64_012195 [Diaporthe eres]|uniref:Carrier domain-containing protein n=1 Tax=Diaporthe eres TaxID=83184 RepID=A0ABR1PG66_DIAER